MNSPEKVSFQLPQQLKVGGYDLLLKEEIGQGGFGSVYLLEFEGEHYAAKLYRMWEILPDGREDILRRIYQEYEISDKIDSPHVVKILTYQEVLGNPFLIMEYCESGSLRNVIGKPQNFQQVKHILRDICLGLQAMHTQDIIHRDIKPENILRKKENYCITDFGISANLNHRLTQTDLLGKAKQVFATAAYSPPEQASGARSFRNTGPTNDIYALGVLLYEVLTLGKLPYGPFETYEKDPISYEAQKKKEQWNRDDLESTAAAPIWIEIIEKCLRNKPSLRYQDTGEILKLLDQLHESPSAEHGIAGYYLEIIEGQHVGQRFFLTNLSKNAGKLRLAIGRKDDSSDNHNNIQIDEANDIYISRFHATLEKSVSHMGNECWTIRDGQWITQEKKWYCSTNGTYVNDQLINQDGQSLQYGDIIRVGRTKLLFRSRQEGNTAH